MHLKVSVKWGHFAQGRQVNTVGTLYSTIYYSKYFIELNIDKSTQYVALWTHKRHPIPRPFGRAMECLLWVLQQKLIVLWRVSTVLQLRFHLRSVICCNGYIDICWLPGKESPGLLQPQGKHRTNNKSHSETQQMQITQQITVQCYYNLVSFLHTICSGHHIQYIPRNMHTVLLCFALLWLCNRS